MVTSEPLLSTQTALGASAPAPAGTVLAFDFGERYTGVALGETSIGVAHPLGLIVATDSAMRLTEIAALVQEWKPALLVIGLPLTLDGAEHQMTRRCRRFSRQLQARFGLPVKMVDERLSSTAASESLQAVGKGGRKHKLLAHQVSAQIILQSYFDDPSSS